MQVKAVNVFDAMFDGLSVPSPYMCSAVEYLKAGHIRMFGNANIGYQELTNLQVSGQFTYDRSDVWITNWYARSNIPNTCAQFRDWAMSTDAQLTVGYHYTPMRSSIYELIFRAPQFEDVRKPLELQLAVKDRAAEDMVNSAARCALGAFQSISGGRMAMSDLPTETQREAWRAVGREMLKTFNFPPCVVLPARQNFQVSINGSGPAFEALCDRVELIGEGTDAGIQPRARLWIHLEGFAFSYDSDAYDSDVQ